MSLTARYDKAREAFSKKDSLASKNLHNIMPLEPAEEHRTAGNHIKSLIYGGLDGTLTTFSLVCGVAGMAVGDYLSTKAEMEYQQREKKREIWEFENYPEGEKAEMVAIYKTKGIAEKDAKNIVDKMAGHKDAFIDVMMVEELGMGEKNEMPLVNAVVTFFSFAVFGLIPLLVYLIAHFVVVNDLFLIATILTAATMFILGAVKTRITQRNWFASGFEMLLVGGIAAAAAYLVGYMLHGLA
jgi:VIT1/CCC1 family predicted Fe2+/Mn2+ transporter